MRTNNNSTALKIKPSQSKLLIITGTPCVGKSTLATYLAKQLKAKRLDLHQHYKELSFGYNHKKQCYDINLTKLQPFIAKKKQEHPLLIFDSHLSHLLPKELVNLCLVLTQSNLKILHNRLQKRKYSQRKIKENLQCEIFQICLQEAQERNHKTILLPDLKKSDFVKVASKVKAHLSK